jgi:SAM-dependent MidA family methyltransferase
MLLEEIIREKIKRDGPIPFHDFMEMALYYPALGYYTSAKDKIGRKGDYYTCCQVSTILAEMLAKQLEEIWHILGKQAFTIVEYGAGTGMLCHDILAYLKNNEQLYANLHYCVIEKSPSMVAIEKARLTEKVNWYSCIHEIPHEVDCILSNELIDNFPVHQVIMGKQLQEVFVGYGNGFVETLLPAPEALNAYLHELQVTLPEGYRTEINMQALHWLKDISHALKKGFVITIDYGHTSAELYSPSKRMGSLVCYKEHQVNNAYFDCIGQQDITAHVNFSALNHWGMQYGLECAGYTLQSHFMHGLGLVKALEHKQHNDIGFYNLIMSISKKFKVLVQQKGLPKKCLSGLQFAGTWV